jgi:hypothetical protein
MNKTKIRTVFGSAVLVAALVTGCGGYSSPSNNNDPGAPAPGASTPYP